MPRDRPVPRCRRGCHTRHTEYESCRRRSCEVCHRRVHRDRPCPPQCGRCSHHHHGTCHRTQCRTCSGYHEGECRAYCAFCHLVGHSPDHCRLLNSADGNLHLTKDSVFRKIELHDMAIYPSQSPDHKIRIETPNMHVAIDGNVSIKFRAPGIAIKDAAGLT